MPRQRADRRKQSFYVPTPMLTELEREAKRQDRPLSWLIQQAWQLSKHQLFKLPDSPASNVA